MTETSSIRELIEATVAESIDEHLRGLHDGIVAHVMQTIDPLLNDRNASASCEALNSAVLRIQSATQQVEILRNLLESANSFSARSALLIVRGTAALGWQARGFANDEAIKTINLQAASEKLANIAASQVPARIRLEDFDPRFVSVMGACAEGECVIVPLIVRGKVAALLYADSGSQGGEIDAHVLDLIARAAGDWIELQALRKAAGAPAQYPRPEQNAAANREPAPVPSPPSSIKESAEPAAAPAPLHQPEVPEPATAEPVPDQVPAAAAHAIEADNQGVPSPEQEIHDKARRFAKLLVDEIILYNQPAVAAGRQNNDLYDRLRDPIEKSRATFNKRYAATSAGQCDYFNEALIARLAAHNQSALGSNFRR